MHKTCQAAMSTTVILFVEVHTVEPVAGCRL